MSLAGGSIQKKQINRIDAASAADIFFGLSTNTLVLVVMLIYDNSLTECNRSSVKAVCIIQCFLMSTSRVVQSYFPLLSGFTW
jgi:hypothetical protein